MKQGFKSDFSKLFFKRELLPLTGRNYSNLLIMIAMLFIAFTVIGFAEGSLRYLETKMRDPFINWVNVIPQPHRGIPINRVLDELNSEEISQKYQLKNAIGYNRIQYNFYDFQDIIAYYESGELNHDRIYPFAARTLDLGDPVMDEIFSSRNHIRGEAYTGASETGLVVTADMLERLNYPLNTPYIWMDFMAARTSDMTDVRVAIPVKVRAVVRYLPGLAAWTASTYFNQQRRYHFGNNPFNPLNDNRLVIAYHGDKEQVSEVVTLLEHLLGQVTMISGHSLASVWSEPRYDENDNIERYLLYANFRPREITMEQLDAIFLELFNHEDTAPFRDYIYRLFDYETRFRSLQTVEQYDRISLNFSNLDQLRQFSVLLENNYNLHIDMAQIESRENYNFISRLTGIISLVLIGFSVVSILLFMAYLLKRHLESISRNLGTFKAFGLSDNILINIYVQIVLFILGCATIIGLILSAMFGYAGGMRLILFLFGAKMETGIYFSLASYYLLLALTLLILFSVITLRAITRKILSNTPGDLIYERE